MKKQILIILILVSSVLTMNAQTCTVASPHLDVQGPLYTRGNIFTLSKAQNDWIPWATRNISTSEATIDLININNAFFQGNVGIGTATPASRLHIGCSNNEGILIGNYNDRLGWDGTNSQPGYHIRFAGYRDVVSNFTGAMISALRTNQCCGGLAQGMELVFSVTQGAAAAGDVNLNEAMRINSVGNIGIGTINPTYKLDVVGTIRAREIKVDINGADFVFEKDYKLMPLSELELFIKVQKHLPEVAPAKEMKENGTDLGNLNSKLLQKMEEMTLYMIEQNKKLEQQNKKLEQQNEKIIELGKQNVKIQALKEKIEKLETASK